MLNAPALRSLVLALGLSTLAQAAMAQAAEIDPIAIALDHLRAESHTRRSVAADDTTIEARDHNTTQRGGLTAVWVRQRLSGIEVHGSDVSVLVSRDGQVLRQHGPLLRRSRQQAPPPVPTLSAR